MLKVKEGREYILGGRVYRGGDQVEGVPAKYARILTGPKGPLEEGQVVNKTDLPPAAIAKAMTPETDPAPLSEPGRYQRRDMRAAGGPTGEETSPSSSPRGRRPRAQESEPSEDEAGS